MRPLADEIRPQTLDQVAGQKHLLGPGALLRRLIEGGTSANMIFYGPSGTGKTTIASIIAKRTEKALYHLNATTASLQDVKAIIADVDTMLAPNGVLLYLDEIQYFNKKQQQSLLEFMENGKITLIASTTENPYFYVYNALLSRSTVFEFKAPDGGGDSARRAAGPGHCPQPQSPAPDLGGGGAGAYRRRVRRRRAQGRQRRGAAGPGRPAGGQRSAHHGGGRRPGCQRSAMRYDREGGRALRPAVRLAEVHPGLRPDAAVYYLGRLLEAGDLLSPCRRLLVIAAEDVGLAIPRPWPLPRPAWTPPGSWACRRPDCLWRRRPFCWPRLPSPTPPTTPSSPPWTTSAGAGWVRCPGTCRTSTPTAPAAARPRPTNTPHDYPHHYVAQRYLPEALGT